MVTIAVMIEDHVIWLIDHPDGAGLVAALVLRAEDDALLVWSVAVAPAAQGQGLGGRLLAFAEAEARRAGLRHLRLFTNADVHREHRALPAARLP